MVFFLAQVTLLFPLFHEHASPQRVQAGEAEPQLILRDINDYNRRFSGQPRSVSLSNAAMGRGHVVVSPFKRQHFLLSVARH